MLPFSESPRPLQRAQAPEASREPAKAGGSAGCFRLRITSDAGLWVERRTIPHRILCTAMAPKAKKDDIGAFAKRFQAASKLRESRGVDPEDGELDLEALADETRLLKRRLASVVSSPAYQNEMREKMDEASEEHCQLIQGVLGPLGWVGKDADRQRADHAEGQARESREKADGLEAHAQELEGKAREMEKEIEALGKDKDVLVAEKQAWTNEKSGLKSEKGKLAHEVQKLKQQNSDHQVHRKLQADAAVNVRERQDEERKKWKKEKEELESRVEQLGNELTKQKAGLEKDRLNALASQKEEMEKEKHAALERQQADLTEQADAAPTRLIEMMERLAEAVADRNRHRRMVQRWVLACLGERVAFSEATNSMRLIRGAAKQFETLVGQMERDEAGDEPVMGVMPGDEEPADQADSELADGRADDEEADESGYEADVEMEDEGAGS